MTAPRALAPPPAQEPDFRHVAETAANFFVFRYRLRPDEGLLYVSSLCRAVTGYGPEEFLASASLGAELVVPRAQFPIEVLWRFPDLAATPVVLAARHRDGRDLSLQYRYLVVTDESGRAVAIDGIAHDVTAQSLSEERLNHLSLHDPLTGLQPHAPP